jgi:hypothetical protein
VRQPPMCGFGVKVKARVRLCFQDFNLARAKPLGLGFHVI